MSQVKRVCGQCPIVAGGNLPKGESLQCPVCEGLHWGCWVQAETPADGCQVLEAAMQATAATACISLIAEDPAHKDDE